MHRNLARQKKSANHDNSADGSRTVDEFEPTTTRRNQPRQKSSRAGHLSIAIEVDSGNENGDDNDPEQRASDRNKKFQLNDEVKLHDGDDEPLDTRRSTRQKKAPTSNAEKASKNTYKLSRTESGPAHPTLKPPKPNDEKEFKAAIFHSYISFGMDMKPQLVHDREAILTLYTISMQSSTRQSAILIEKILERKAKAVQHVVQAFPHTSDETAYKREVALSRFYTRRASGSIQ